MGRLVLYLIASLDGAVDDPTRTFPTDVPPPAPPAFDADLERHEARLIANQSAVLLGRGMYDEWARYWPITTMGPGTAEVAWGNLSRSIDIVANPGAQGVTVRFLEKATAAPVP